MSKHILITGCSTGFGHDSALRFARKGHHVHATMRDLAGRNRPAADGLRALAKAENLQLTLHEMDVTSDTSVAAAMAGMPVIDVLINNAGLGYGGPVESFTPDQILRQLDVNVVGTIRLARAVLPGMRAAKSGLILQVSSVAGRAAFPGFGVYHASKWGLEGISEAMRYELAPLGIDVSLVEPGPFSTHFFDNLVAGEDVEVAAAYPHVAAFGEGFETMVTEAFEAADAPTDPAIVIDLFEQLVDAAPGTRPLRTIAGLDFGLQALNDAVEPIRKLSLETMQIADWDGVKLPV